MPLFATIVAAVVVGEAWSPSLFLGFPGLAVWFTWVSLFPSLAFFATFSELSLALFGVVSLTVSLIAIIAEVLFFGGFVLPLCVFVRASFLLLSLSIRFRSLDFAVLHILGHYQQFLLVSSDQAIWFEEG